MELNVIVRTRKQDVDIVERILPKAIENYKQLSKKDCSVFVDKETYLPNDTTGGVEILSQTGRIKVTFMNTEEEQIFKKKIVNFY